MRVHCNWRNSKNIEEKTEQAQRRKDTKNGIAVHASKTQHKVDWEAATVKQVETNYTRRRTVEAVHIRKQEATSNLDCSWHLSLCLLYTSPSPRDS